MCLCSVRSSGPCPNPSGDVTNQILTDEEMEASWAVRDGVRLQFCAIPKPRHVLDAGSPGCRATQRVAEWKARWFPWAAAGEWVSPPVANFRGLESGFQERKKSSLGSSVPTLIPSG